MAVTANDEANLVASMVGKSMGAKQTICRIEASGLRGPAAHAVREASGADLFIDPDAETAAEVLELLDFPGADEVAHRHHAILKVKLGSVASPPAGLVELATHAEAHRAALDHQ